jgi:hypothetical protein
MYVPRYARIGGQPKLLRSLFCIFLAAPCVALCFSQNGSSSGGALEIDKAVLPTPINQPPDALAQIRHRQDQITRRNFDAANALRQRQIADETMKLLILARDLKLQMDKLGNDPLPDKLMREVEVIEAFARDVHKKMTLTVGPG